MHHPTDRIAHTTAFVTPVVEYCRLLVSSNPVSRKEGNVLFNNALKQFIYGYIWCQTYGKGPAWFTSSD